MLTERSIINFLVWVGGLIVGPYLAIATLSGDKSPILIALAVCFLVFTFGWGKDRLCLLPLFGTFWAGKLNFLPLQLAPSDACALALLLYYFIAYFALQRKAMKTGPMFFFIPILILGAILLYHARDTGLHSIGSSREGSRGAIFMLVACCCYLCGVSVNTPTPSSFVRFPLFCVAAVVLSAIPYTVTTYLPGTAPYFFLITDNINGGAFTVEVLNHEGIVRNQGQSMVGAAVMIYLISYYPIFSWWRPHRWWIPIVAVCCCALVVLGGFRSALAVFGLSIWMGILCHYRWRSLFFVPPLVLGLFFLMAAQDSRLVNLPLAAQRSLSFLPGDWDNEAVEAAESSNDFRKKIQETYLREEAAKSPFFGNGTSFDEDEFEQYTFMARTQETDNGYYQSKEFVTAKMFHTGWISVYDAVGLVGSAAFVFFGLSLIWVTGRKIFGKNVDRQSPLFPLKVWMFCNIPPTFVGYFTVFGDLKLTFPVFCYYAILWTQLDRLERYGYTANGSVREVAFDPVRTETAVPASVS